MREYELPAHIAAKMHFTGYIPRQIAGHYACYPAEAEQAVAHFVRQLGQRGILGLR